MKKLLIFSCCLINAIIFAQTNPSNYKIVNKIHLEGDAGWDYLNADDVSGHLFVSHGSMTQVVDMSKGELIATIPDTKGVHGIAVANDLNKGYISCGRDSSVTIFDLKSFATIGKIKVTGRNPDAILYEPLNKRVYTFNGGSSNATVIDATTDKVIETIKLEGKPEFSATDGKGHVYVNIEDKSLIDLINAKTLQVEKSWPIAPGGEASGLAIDIENNLLFAVCDNKLMIVLDVTTGKVVGSLPIGERVDGAAFDPTLKCAYSSNGEGTITVVKEESKDSFKVLENVVTQRGARTITVDKKTHHIYLPTAEFGETPAATTENPRPRPKIKENSFVILDIAPIK
jgi:YVTN family beta-propeller protein